MAKQHRARPLCRISASCNIGFGPSSRQAIDVFVPETAPEGRPLLVLVPGAWWHGERESLRGHAMLLAQEGWPVAIVGHRLFDEQPNGIPMRKDVEEGSLRAIEECGINGYECHGLVVVGSGSGCLVAQLAAYDMQASGSSAITGCVLVGAVPQQAWRDCGEREQKQLQRFTGKQAELDILAKTSADCPPLLALIAKDDQLLPAAAANDWCDKLRQAGADIERHDFKRGGHDLLADAIGPASHDVVDRLLRWCEDRGKQHFGEPLIGEREIDRKLEKQFSAD